MTSSVGCVEKGHTYESDGSYYFRIATFPQYGKLSQSDFEGMIDGASRVDVDEYDKDNARDFALWKAPKPGEPSWDTSSGRAGPAGTSMLRDVDEVPGGDLRHPCGRR